MKVDATILKKWASWVAIVLMASGVGVTVKLLEGVELRVVQLVDHQAEILRARDVYIMDERGKSHCPDDGGIVRVPRGLISVFSTATGKVIQVEDIPKGGPSPYRVVVRGFVRSTKVP